ncbi:serine/threonine protein kinase [Rubrivivax rivuli]|uniref:serine/threonine protein kinase n=1 Tax=Rubrivivax rivuli TaxID=1862385 RepID=UPI0026A6DC1B|nr:serine/threonine-protein kinase [Rubrivivax rivuli]
MSTQMQRIASDNPSALPPGTRLGEFELLSLLGVGGFGIVYLAFDHALEREVAVKEYMPASLAGRTETMHVSLRSQSDAETFALGLKSFVNEAKMLARFDHPSLLKVHRFWEANGTAYMAMPVMRGRTLKEVRAQLGVAPDEAWLRALLTPLLGAIERLHSEGVYHRDIAPDNIQIDSEGRPVLLDFGAARRVINDKSQTLTAILKPAYAPIEQYAEAGSVKQGPWTDLYALGATLHYLLLNRPPPPATTRAVHDEASALSTEACPGCSENFLRTIDWMLAPRPADRPQNVAALREVLEGHQAPPLRRADTPSPSQWDRTVLASPAPMPSAPAPAALPDPEATRVMPAAPAPGRLTSTDFDLPLDVPPVVPSPPALHIAAPPVSAALAQQPATPARRSWLPLGLGVGVVAVAGLAFALWPRGGAVPGVDAAASAALAASASAMAPGLPGTGASAPAVAVPESKVTTVVVPETAPRAATNAPVATTARPGTEKPTPPGAAEAAKAAQRATATPAPAAAMPAAPPPVVAAPPAPVVVAPAPTVTPAAAPVVAPAASQATKPAVATGPEAICEGRNPVMYFVCMERECLRSRFSEHADCQKWRKEARREVN